MPLSALHRHLVRRIFSRLAANPDNSTTLFYQRLFELNPHLRTVKDMENFEQQHHLMEILALAVKFMDQPVELAGWVDDMILNTGVQWKDATISKTSTTFDE